MNMFALTTLALFAPESGMAGQNECSGFFGCAWQHFDEGGWGMYPILLLAIATVVIIIERLLFLQRAKIDKRNLVSHLKTQIMSGNVQGAVQVCSSNPTPLTRIIHAGLSNINRSEKEIQAAMDEAALQELPGIEKRTGYLAMLGNLATLAGLLGTITGLIKSFASVAGVDPTMKATMLARGISEAMNCTAFGLGTGITALLAFALLNGQTQKILDDINEVSVSVMNLVVTHRGQKG
jgi:biopolymer transport protein ExbB/TolQ